MIYKTFTLKSYINDLHNLKNRKGLVPNPKRIIISTSLLPNIFYEDIKIKYKKEKSSMDFMDFMGYSQNIKEEQREEQEKQEEQSSCVKRVKGLGSILREIYKGKVPKDVEIELFVKYPKGKGNCKGILEKIEKPGEIYLAVPLRTNNSIETENVYFFLRSFRFPNAKSPKEIMEKAHSIKMLLQRVSKSKEGLEDVLLRCTEQDL